MRGKQFQCFALTAVKLLPSLFSPLSFRPGKIGFDFIVKQRRRLDTPDRMPFLTRWGRHKAACLRTAAFTLFRLKLLYRPGDREHLVVEKLLDTQSNFYIASAIASLTRLV